MSEKLAFDITLLHSVDVAADNLSALVMEASNVHPRVTYFSRFAPHLVWDTPADKVSSLETIQIQSLLKSHHNQSGIVVSISSPDLNLDWSEARVNLYCTDHSENYGIALPASDFMSLNLPSGNEPIFLPTDLTHLPNHLNLPQSIWNDILSGEAKRRKLEAETLAIPIATAMLGMAQTTTDSITVGAWAETQMASHGFTMQAAGSGCGLTNSEIMASNATTVTSNEHSGICKPIVCPNCGWVADSYAAGEIQAHRIILCPTCTYNPSTRSVETQTPSQVFSKTDSTPTPVFGITSSILGQNPDVLKVQSEVPKYDLVIGLLFPWILDQQLPESLD